MRVPLRLRWGTVDAVTNSVGTIVALEGRCRDGTEFSIPVTSEQVWLWLEGGSLIQDAFPELSPQQREILISGISPAQFERLFGDDGDGEEPA